MQIQQSGSKNAQERAWQSATTTENLQPNRTWTVSNRNRLNVTIPYHLNVEKPSYMNWCQARRL